MDKIIYGKKVGKDTIMYILARFLKEHNCYHLWLANIKKYPSHSYSYSKLLSYVDNEHYSELIMQAPFDWEEVSTDYMGGSYNRERFYHDAYGGRWNLFQFWTDMSNEWKKLLK